MGQWMVFRCPMISPSVLFTLMTLYRFPLGHISHSSMTKIGQKLLKNRFLAVLSSIAYSTHNIRFFLDTEWWPVILWYHPWCLLLSWPHIGTLWPMICTHLWPKSPKVVRKHVFGNFYLSITSYSTLNLVSWANEWCRVILWYHPWYDLH